MIATIAIPATPPSSLSQNARIHWAKRYRISADWKDVAGAAAWDAKCNDGVERDPVATYVLDIAVYWEKGHRFVDDDNLIASFKPARDLIAAVLGE